MPRKRTPYPHNDPEAIAALEAHSLPNAKIVTTFEADGLLYLRSAGYSPALFGDQYPRPMFQLIEEDHSQSYYAPWVQPCPRCDDWSRTAQCPDHPERPLSQTSFIRSPAEPPVGLYANAPVAYYQAGLRNLWEAADRRVRIEVNGESLQGVSGFSFDAEGRSDT